MQSTISNQKSPNSISIEKSIDYDFKDKKLLALALTHSSYANENNLKVNNQRLEFLGDATLELVISEILFERFPNIAEGDLTKKRASLVCEANLSSLARCLYIGELLKLSKGEQITGGRERDSLLADATEAVFGAVFVDGGYAAAKHVILRVMSETIMSSEQKDYKTALQELIQKTSQTTVTYKILEEIGPVHNRTFKTQVMHADNPLGVGVGKSKKESEQNAAFEALKLLK